MSNSAPPVKTFRYDDRRTFACVNESEARFLAGKVHPARPRRCAAASVPLAPEADT